MSHEEAYKQWIATLKSLDTQAFEAALTEAQLAALAEVPPEKRQLALLGGLHKARLKLPEMSDAERAESEAWLKDNGVGKPARH